MHDKFSWAFAGLSFFLFCLSAFGVKDFSAEAMSIPLVMALILRCTSDIIKAIKDGKDN